MTAGHQTTLRNAIHCAGVGLHTGREVRMTLRPTRANTGVVFRRVDVDPEHSEIPARFDLVTQTTLGTVLTNKHGVRLSTVEHIMAALSGMGVDNVIVEVNGEEVPIMDGSAGPFVFLLECAGLVELKARRRILTVRDTVLVQDGDKFAKIEPSDGFDLDIQIAFETPAIRHQRYVARVDRGLFRDELSRARTFGFMRDVAQLQAAGLARGGSLDNSIVIDDDRILNRNGLRFSDEFVRHKALDVVGDLALAGGAINGRVSAYKPGHGLNNLLLRALFADAGAFEWVDAEQEPVAPYYADHDVPLVANL